MNKRWQQFVAVILSALALTALFHRPAWAQAPPVQSAVISGPGTITVVQGVSGSCVRVLAVVMVENNSSGTWKFQSSTGPTDLTGNLFMSSGPSGNATATGVIEFSPNSSGWFQTAPGDSLILFLNNAPGTGPSGIGGVLTYEIVKC